MDSKKYESEINSSKNLSELTEIEIKLLGRNGEINKLLSEIKNIPNEEKREYGQKVNSLKDAINQLILLKKKKLETSKKDEFFDKTLPGKSYPKGSIHIVSYAIEEITKIFENFGFFFIDSSNVKLALLAKSKSRNKKSIVLSRSKFSTDSMFSAL